MFGTYREALRTPGALAFTTAGFVARLPIAIIGLAIVLLVSTTTGSYALAGGLSATFALAAATGGIATSRITDRLGQRRMLPGLVLAEALLLALFVVSVTQEFPIAVSFLLVAGAGSVQPSIGSFVRARWVFVAPNSRTLQAGFAWESILDELIFTLGPLIAATLAVNVALPLPLIVAATLIAAGGLSLARLKGSEPPPHPRVEGRQPQSVLKSPGILAPIVGSLGLGALFGAFDVATVAFTEERNSTGAAGLVLALWAFGSLIGGLFYGSRAWRIDLPSQWLLSTTLLMVVVIPAIFVGSVPALAFAAFIAGTAVAPSLIGVFSLTERLVHAQRLTEGLTWTNSALALGFALGSSVGGGLIDALGTTSSFILAFGGTAAAFLAALVSRGRLSALLATTPVDSDATVPVPWNDEPVSGISAPVITPNEDHSGSAADPQ